MTEARGALLSTIEYPDGGAGESTVPATIGRFEITGVLGRGGMGVVLAGRDPALQRAVAIKLIPERFAPGDSGRARFEREARAMAKLSHPNVIAVFEVGEVDSHPFIAMELVDGQTLRAWQAGPPKPWRVVVPIYIEAARGLAAAHAAGLVHRDFKPDNVLLCADMRPRVSDFGLVSGEGATTPNSERWVGTPPYMPREQWLDESVGPAADQFAFCVSLWEALFGERPFTGETTDEIRAAICSGKRGSPPSTDVPRTLAQIVERGLATAATDRWPSMQALIVELQRVVRPSRHVLFGGIAITAVAAAITIVALPGQGAEDPCPPPIARSETLWGTAGREGVLAKVRAVDPAHADAHIAAIVRAFDPFVTQWQLGTVDTCRSAPDEIAAQRTACLDERLAFGTGFVERILGATTGAELDKIIPSLRELPSPASCADARTLASFTMPPTPAGRTEATALGDETRAIELSRLTGKMPGLRERGASLLIRARALDHAPTTARALHVVAHVVSDLTDSAAAATLMKELTAVAAKAPDDASAAWAWCNLLRLTAFDEGKPAAAVAMLPAA